MAYSEDFSKYNIVSGIEKSFTKDQLLRIYNKIYYSREFEKHIIESVNNREINYQVYLSLGQEAVAASVSEVANDSQVFTQHRAHDMYLCLGGDPCKLRDELKGLDSGSSGGRAGSNCLQIHNNNIDMYGHHGLIGENVPQAVGAALGNRRHTICIFGDGAAEEDYIGPSLGFSTKWELPILYICMDNNMSILTEKKIRRNWRLEKVAEAYGIKSYDLADCPFTILDILRKYTWEEPLLLNCRVCRERWHVGVGTDGERAWKRNIIVRNMLIEMGYQSDVLNIEKNIKEEMEKLWAR